PPEVEIGPTIVSPNQVGQIEDLIKRNPVENFDLRRVVNVFSTYYEFFELQVIGAYVERQTVQLPKELLGSIRDKDVRDRISAAFKMLSNQSRISGEGIRRQAAEIRRRFSQHHPIYGGVALKATRPARNEQIGRLKDGIEAHKKRVLERLGNDVRRS